ncbi:MAG: hypothetical protein H0U66_02015 [Gemmatimonadaceae bacterium]|nr:hypothetical protein [Gemmatimonadaceae bacterium]
MSLFLVAASFVPGLAVLAWHLRERAKLRRFEAACNEEREETLIRYAGDDEITERRQSFSGFPFQKRQR